tara:strand:- start:1214 stop:2230 length:1017 start_codon:yes stop_codon:yes gene_type:complete
MIALSKHLYIVDDIKWSIIDAVVKKRTKESIFWVTEYYISGYAKETWQLIWIIYSSFFFSKNIYYNKSITKAYIKWQKTRDIAIVLEIIYKFNMCKVDCMFFKIFISKLKLKKIKKEIDDEYYTKTCISKKNIFVNLVKSLVHMNYKNVWFFLQYNYNKALSIIQKFYKSTIKIVDLDINDKHVQVLMFVYKQNNVEVKKRRFKIKLRKDLINYHKSLFDKIPIHKTLNKKRHFGIPKSIGCFDLNRFCYKQQDLREMYFYNWEYYANNCPLWSKRFAEYKVVFDENNKPKFPNDDMFELFYSNYNLEPDEQTNETHNKSLIDIRKQTLNHWIQSIKN